MQKVEEPSHVGGKAGGRDVGLFARGLALAGGALAFLIAMVVTVSVMKAWLTNRPLPDIEDYAGIATALALFMFLPYCQRRRAHIVVDTFTGRLQQPLLRLIDGLWDLAYAVAMAVLAYCLTLGAYEKYANGETAAPNITTVMKWPVIAVVALLVAIMAVTALLSALDRLRGRP